jgi:5-methylcytosine-specific restriction endonuclease McrA
MATHGYYSTKHWRELRAAALRRDRWQCTVAGCRRQATIVDHITTRPRQAEPSAEDRLDNLRSLCATHDAQMKEHGPRRGTARLIGCDADGWPLAP